MKVLFIELPEIDCLREISARLVLLQLERAWLESQANYEFRASGSDLALFSACLRSLWPQFH